MQPEPETTSRSVVRNQTSLRCAVMPFPSSSALADHAARVRAAPDGVGQADPRPCNLARSGLASQLMHQLDDLPECRGPEWLALREEPPAGIHREGGAEQGRTVGEELRLLRRVAQAELLIRQQLPSGDGVLALDDVDVGGP